MRADRRVSRWRVSRRCDERADQRRGENEGSARIAMLRSEDCYRPSSSRVTNKHATRAVGLPGRRGGRQSPVGAAVPPQPGYARALMAGDALDVTVVGEQQM